MKLTKIISTGCVVMTFALLFVSCVKEKGKEVALEQIDFVNKTSVQVFNAMVGSTRNYVYVDGVPVNGASLTYGNLFPSSSVNFAVTSGFRAFLIRDTQVVATPVTTQLPISFAEDFKASGNYTIFMYDTTTAAKQKTVLNNIVVPADTTARLRFANFIYNPTGLTAFDIFSVKQNANIFTNVQVTDVTEYIPYASRITDTFYIRLTGTLTNLQNFRPTAGTVPGALVDILGVLTPTQKRSYTLIFRGGYRASTTTNTTVRTLSTFVNY